MQLASIKLSEISQFQKAKHHAFPGIFDKQYMEYEEVICVSKTDILRFCLFAYSSLLHPRGTMTFLFLVVLFI